MNASELWEKIYKLCKMSGKINEFEYNLYFNVVKVKEYEDDTLYLICDSLLSKEVIEKNLKQIKDIAEVVSGKKTNVIIEVEKNDSVKEEKIYKVEDVYKVKEFNKNNLETGLKPSNRMDNFIVGDNSKLAYEACFAVISSVVERDEPAYNPLFIYGNSGLGKTHLIQAVGNEILNRRSDKRVRYITSEEFSNEYYKVIREYKIEEFRNVFRNLDVLLLDDIQFFEKIFAQGEGKVEEEFFHTFNKLYELGKQIIMISDKFPKDMKNLSKRLESRFVQGATIEMRNPGYETRMQILKNFVDTRNIKVENDILEYIAHNVNSNVRELEGFITTIILRSNISGEEITLKSVIEEQEKRIKSEKAKITAEKIIETVSKEYSISVADIKSTKRKSEIVMARNIAMYIIKDMLDYNLTTIGGLFGGRDHSTVIHTLRKIESEIELDSSFEKKIERIKQSINN